MLYDINQGSSSALRPDTGRYLQSGDSFVIEADFPDLPGSSSAPAQEPESHYEVINCETGEIRFIKDDPVYRVLKHALITAGFHIDTVKTEREHNAIVGHPYLDHLYAFLVARTAAMKDRSLEHALIHAIDCGNREEMKRISEKLRRRKTIGLRVIRSEK